MRCYRFRPRSRLLAASFLLMAAVSTARGDAISSTYTVTDLGSASALSRNPIGDGIVTSIDGQTAYAFPQTFAGTSIPTPANFPLLDPVPTGPDGTGYSFASGVTQYPSGIAIAYNQVGFNNSSTQSGSWQGADLYYVQRNPDGSWGQPIGLMSSTKNNGAPTGYQPNVSAELSKSGYILESTHQVSGTQVGNGAAVYNIYTNAYTNLSTLPALASSGYTNFLAAGIDDAGRVLVWATRNFPNQNTLASQELLLLSPPGVSPDPIPAATPEPSAWMVMALAMAGFATLKVRQRRRRE
jgi:hypothetical protein